MVLRLLKSFFSIVILSEAKNLSAQFEKLNEILRRGGKPPLLRMTIPAKFLKNLILFHHTANYRLARIRNFIAAIGVLLLYPNFPMFSGTIEKALPISLIQQKIDSAQSGDTIVITGRRYLGNLVIDRRVVLLGLNSPVVCGDGVGSVVTCTADSCTLKGFIIEHSGAMLVNEDAGVLVKSKGNLIEENQLRDVLFGVYLLAADGNSIVRNTIVGRQRLELGERGSGMHLFNSHHNKFKGNIIRDVRDGFYIQYANHTLIEENEASGLRYGVHYMYADSNVFLRNKFFDNVAGAAIMYSRGILMRGNEFVHNRGFSSFGILFQDCHGLVADSNLIADNVVGMFYESSTDNLFRHNIIARNDVALEMFQNSTGNTFSENNFLENLSPLIIIGKHTETRWSFNGAGNYWSSYDGYDLDHDGIGDVPMKIQNVFSYLEGVRPNLRLYLNSPASQALSMATEAFPIVAINEEVDDHPLVRPVPLFSIVVAGSTNSPAPLVAGSKEAKGGALYVPMLLILIAVGISYFHLARREAI
jgi:nitrous oxidase accessory protein